MPSATVLQSRDSARWSRLVYYFSPQASGLRPERINRIGAPVHRSTFIFFSTFLVSALPVAQCPRIPSCHSSPQPPVQENRERILLLPIFTAAPFLLFF